MSGQKGFTTQRLVMLAMMTAVVFAVNYPRIIIPLPTGETSLLYDNMLVGGLPFAAAAALLPLKIPASLFNGAAAVAAAPPLYLAIRSAMKRAHLPLA